MSKVPDDVATKILVACGRCCCVCRRYSPTLLQVHHIVEQSKGGTNDPDNLIAVCLTCHSDVHTDRPFTRRFSIEELKQHRNRVILQVNEGKLVPPNNPSLHQPDLTKLLTESSKEPPEIRDLYGYAKMLLAIIGESKHGDMWVYDNPTSLQVTVSSKDAFYSRNPREMASMRSAIGELVTRGLVSANQNKVHFQMTEQGYLAFDVLMSYAKSLPKN